MAIAADSADAVTDTVDPCASATDRTDAAESSCANGEDDTGTESNEHTDTNLDTEPEVDEPSQAQRERSAVKLASVFGLVALVAAGSLAGWLGWRTYQSHASRVQRDQYVQAGRQAALNLTTISYTEAEADVARITDSATGAFQADFSQRAQDFISVVKKAQSVSRGTITGAGLESERGDQAQVLVAVSVKTTIPTDQDPPLRGWRMRIGLQRTSAGVKVSNVEFVP